MMSKLIKIETTKQLDLYVRGHIEEVLIGKYTSTPRRLHLHPEEDVDGDGVACNAITDREGGWHPKEFGVYPVDHHQICTPCAEARFDVVVLYE